MRTTDRTTESVLEQLEPALAEALTRLARYDRRNQALLHRTRLFYGISLLGLVAALLLGGGAALYAIHVNSDRITDVQQARVTAILFACRQQNGAHINTLVFLDRTELGQLHAHVGPGHYPQIERHTLAVLRRQPTSKRTALLTTHRLLVAFVDNLAPLENCMAQARRTAGRAN